MAMADAVDTHTAGRGHEMEGRAIDVHSAVQRNDEVAIKNYVSRGGDLEARDKDALTPLHVAAAGGFTDMVEYLTKEGASVDCVSKIRHTPLHLACRFGHLAVVLLLLANQAELNSQDKDGNTPLHKAASNGKALLCRELVKRGADIDARNDTAYTPLHWACFKGHKAAGEQLLKCGANINATSSRRATALFMSAYYGHVDVTLLLLAWGADSTISNEDGIKPGDTFFSEVPPVQQAQTRRLFAERQALLVKGYEATRRNMALMYMRSERSDLSLQHSQGEVVALWDKLVKREKELNISKIGARDLSHAVKAMKSALEKTRQEARTMRNQISALEAEVEAAQAAFHRNRDQAQEERERAEKAERDLVDLVAPFRTKGSRCGVDGQEDGGGKSPLFVSTDERKYPSNSGSFVENDASTVAHRRERTQRKGQSSGEKEQCRPTHTEAIGSGGLQGREERSERSRSSEGGVNARKRSAKSQALRSSSFCSTEDEFSEDVRDRSLRRMCTTTTSSSRSPSRLPPPLTSTLSINSNLGRNGDEPGTLYLRGRNPIPSPNIAMGICSGGSFGKTERRSSGVGAARSASPTLVPSLPPGNVAAHASAINTRVAELGEKAAVPLPQTSGSLSRSGSLSSLLMAHLGPNVAPSPSCRRGSDPVPVYLGAGNGYGNSKRRTSTERSGSPPPCIPSLSSSAVHRFARSGSAPSALPRSTEYEITNSSTADQTHQEKENSPRKLKASISTESDSSATAGNMGIIVGIDSVALATENESVGYPHEKDRRGGAIENGGGSSVTMTTATVAHLVVLGKHDAEGEHGGDKTMPASPESLGAEDGGGADGSGGRDDAEEHLQRSITDGSSSAAVAVSTGAVKRTQ